MGTAIWNDSIRSLKIFGKLSPESYATKQRQKVKTYQVGAYSTYCTQLKVYCFIRVPGSLGITFW